METKAASAWLRSTRSFGAAEAANLIDSLAAENEQLRAELAKRQSLTEAALQVAESAQRRAARDRAASQAREKALREALRQTIEEMRERCAREMDRIAKSCRAEGSDPEPFEWAAAAIRALEVKP